MAARKKDLFPDRKKGPRSGFLRVMFSVRPDQLAAVQAEASKRMRERERPQARAGEIVREAIDSWMRAR